MSVNWDNIYGHKINKVVTDRFLSSSKIPHAFLFIGKQGIGKDFFAIRLAQIISQKFSPIQAQSQIQNGLAELNEPYIKYIFALPRVEVKLTIPAHLKNLIQMLLRRLRNNSR